MGIALSGIPAPTPADPWVAAQRTNLTDLRAEVASSRPDLSGATWAKLTGAGVAGLGVGALGLVLGGSISNDMSLGRALLTTFGLGAAGVAAGGAGGAFLGSYLTRPRGVDADTIRSTHQVDVENHLRIIDAQLAALDAANADTPHI